MPMGQDHDSHAVRAIMWPIESKALDSHFDIALSTVEIDEFQLSNRDNTTTIVTGTVDRIASKCMERCRIWPLTGLVSNDWYFFVSLFNNLFIVFCCCCCCLRLRRTFNLLALSCAFSKFGLLERVNWATTERLKDTHRMCRSINKNVNYNARARFHLHRNIRRIHETNRIEHIPSDVRCHVHDWNFNFEWFCFPVELHALKFVSLSVGENVEGEISSRH